MSRAIFGVLILRVTPSGTYSHSEASAHLTSGNVRGCASLRRHHREHARGDPSDASAHVPARPYAGGAARGNTHIFLQQLQEVEPREVRGVGVARVRAGGSRMLAWITYGGPDGAGALGLEEGALLSFYNTEVRMHGNNRAKVVAYLRPMHNRNAQQMFV
eukprot:scaffold1411_cov125-Isochrysis_galbana.AAC.9